MKARFISTVDLLFRMTMVVFITTICALVFNTSRNVTFPVKWSPPPPPAMVLADAEQLEAALKTPGAILIDSRARAFYDLGHIPGAVSLTLDEFDQDHKSAVSILPEPPLNTPLIVYCTDAMCKMAGDLALRLGYLGYEPAIFSPGYQGWLDAGRQVEIEENGLTKLVTPDEQ